jgi:ATP-binding cassette subfamily B protein
MNGVDVPGSFPACQESEQVHNSYEAAPDGQKRSVAALLKSSIFRRPTVVAYIVAVTVAMHILAAGPAFVLRIVVDSAGRSAKISEPLFFAGAIFAASAFYAWAAWLQTSLVLFIRDNVDVDVRRGMLSRLLAAPFTFLHGRSIGDLMKPFITVSLVGDQIANEHLTGLLSGILALFYLGLIALFVPLLSAELLLLTVTAILLAICVYRSQIPQQRSELALHSAQQNSLLEIVSGIETIKAFRAETAYLNAWKRQLASQFQSEEQRMRTDLWHGVLQGVMSNAQIVLTLIAIMVWTATRGLSIGSMFAILQLSAAYWASLSSLIRSGRGFAFAIPRIEPGDEILALPSRSISGVRQECADGGIVVEKIWFRYGNHRPWLFKDYDLVVQPRSQARLPGPSGAGKTTLLRLIAGFYQPEKGRILIDGMNSSSEISGLMYLPQFVHIFRGSIMDNLKILSGHVSMTRMMAAAEQTGLAAWVSSLPMQYETMLNSGGSALSGGQRQLIALTAVAASDARILLLDEAMANLDVVTQQRILASGMFSDRTIIYTCHSRDLFS